MSLKTDLRLAPVALALAIVALSASTAPAQSASKIEEAAALSVVAAAKAKAGQHTLCAEIFVQAYRLDPSYLGYLYSAARCYQKAKALDASEQGYRAFLARAPAEHPLRSRADAHLAEIIKQREEQVVPGTGPGTGTSTAAKPVGGAREATASTAPASSDRPHATSAASGENKRLSLMPVQRSTTRSLKIAWATVGAGGLALLGGAILGIVARADASELQTELEPQASSNLIGAMSHADAVQRADAINQRGFVAFSLLGLGAAAVAGGTALFLLDDSEDATGAVVAPTLGGLTVHGRF